MMQQRKPQLPDAFKVRDVGHPASEAIKAYARASIGEGLRRRGMAEEAIGQHLGAIEGDLSTLDQSFIAANILQETPPANRRSI